MKKKYADIKLNRARLARIEQANEIIAEYQADGLVVTLRQLYYQFVARGLSENTVRAYKNLGPAISDGRLAGLIDWDAIEDRTRETITPPHWSSPAQILRSAAASYAVDKWIDQEFAPEVWIEKEALAGVIADECRRLDVPFFACRGYPSQSSMNEAGERFRAYLREGREPIVFHLGDHDPSGIDMSRDIEERLTMFCEGNAITVERIALNRDQIDEIGCPPNPAKLSDSRAAEYVAVHGYDSWELDALSPRYLVDLVRNAIADVRNDELYQERLDQELDARDKLLIFAGEWQ